MTSSNGLAGAPRRRRWPWIVGGVAVLVVLVLIFSSGSSAPKYKTQPIAQDRLTVTVSATGTIQPVDQVEVGAEISGLVAELLADYNDQVTAGQVLARLDTASLVARVKQSEANLLAAQASVAEAKAAVVLAQARANRTKALAESRVASVQTLDTDMAELARSKAAQQAAEAQVKVAEAVLDSDRSDLEKATIRSPVDGVVISRSVELGQTIVASLQTPVLFTVARDLKAMELYLDVDEADIGHIAVGQKASFSVDAYPTKLFAAEVTSVRLAPKSEQGVVTYEVLARVDNPDLLLRPGMTATADVISAVHDGVLVVPNGALRFTPATVAADTLDKLPPDQRRIWLMEGGEPKPVVVTIGLSDGRRTEISASGLAAGAEVIVDIQRELPGR